MRAKAVVLGVQQFVGKRLVDARFFVQGGVAGQFFLVFRADFVLFVQTGSAERIDSQRIQFDVPGDGGGRHLRNGKHKRPFFQACLECFQRLFRKAKNGPVTTSEHVGISSRALVRALSANARAKPDGLAGDRWGVSSGQPGRTG